jgi:hypothetical protein
MSPGAALLREPAGRGCLSLLLRAGPNTSVSSRLPSLASSPVRCRASDEVGWRNPGERRAWIVVLGLACHTSGGARLLGLARLCAARRSSSDLDRRRGG